MTAPPDPPLDAEALRARLLEQCLDVDYLALRPHAARNALFLVTPSPALVDVAVAVATNRDRVLAHWIEQGAVRRPTREELMAWEGAPLTKFRFVIVQPFVLAELLAD